MKKLTIFECGNGLFGYELDGGNGTGSGDTRIGWCHIEKVIARMSPSTSLAAAMQVGSSQQITASGQNQAGPYGWGGQARTDRELRLECVRLAIQAGVPYDRVISWAAGLEERVTWKSASHRATCASSGPAESCYCQANKNATAS